MDPEAAAAATGSWLPLAVGGGFCVMSSLFFGLYKFQSRLLYFPQFPIGANERYDETPYDYKMKFEDVYLNTHDGATVHLWVIRQEQDARRKPTLVMFHGNAGNISHRLPHALRLYKNCDVNLALVSYRGYGTSKGTPSEEGFKTDAQAVIEHLSNRDDIDPNFLILYGSSIGGAVTIATTHALQHKIRAIILENTFTHIGDMVDIVFPILKPFKFLLTNPWASRDIIGHIEVPILFISGREDELVPPWMMDKLHELAVKSKLKKMVHVLDGTHNDTWLRGGQNYYTELLAFFRTISSIESKNVIN